MDPEIAMRLMETYRQGAPTARADQIRFLQTAYPGETIRGTAPEQMHDQQLYAVTRSVYGQAQRLDREARREEQKLIAQEQQERATGEYHRHLAEIFNVDPEDYSWQELEARILE